MRLQVTKVDARTRAGNCAGRSVVDLDTGKSIGYVTTNANSVVPTRFISLFDGKYSAEFNTHDACQAFAKGVEAVLNHMISTGAEELAKEDAAA